MREVRGSELRGQRTRRLRLKAAQSAHGPAAKHIKAVRIEEQFVLAAWPEAELQIAPGCLLAKSLRSEVLWRKSLQALQTAGIVKRALLPGVRLEALCRHSGSNERKARADSTIWRRHRIIIEL